tara:strand:+ start:2634 stop:3767 length:1134 start_codon:yes stop_codon:yes gene_type:complete
MKIFLVTSGATYSTKDLSYAYSEAFEELGHEVLTYPMEEVYQPLRELCRLQGCLESNVQDGKHVDLLNTADSRAKNFASCPIVPNVICERPDLVIFVHGINIPEEVMQSVTLLGIKTALILPDEPQEVDISKTYSHVVNYVFTNERNTVEIHQQNSQKHKVFCGDDLYCVSYLPTAAYTHALDRAAEALPHPWRTTGYCSENLFIGSMYPERYVFLHSIIDAFCNDNDKVVGPGNAENDKMLGLGHKRVSKKLPYEEYAKYLWASTRFIDKPRNENITYPYGKQNKEGIRATNLSPRIYEALYCRCLVITDSTRACVNDFSDVCKNTVQIYSSPMEVRQLMDESCTVFDDRIKAQEYIRENHSYVNRAKSIIEITGE